MHSAILVVRISLSIKKSKSNSDSDEGKPSPFFKSSVTSDCNVSEFAFDGIFK